MKSRFKTLALELIAHGVQSQYMARIEAHIDMEQRLDGLQVEHQQEMASALGRSDLRVNLELAELELRKARYDRAVSAGAPLSERARLAHEFNEQRKVAQRRLRELLIHREAVGFRRHQLLDEMYPISAKLPVPQLECEAEAA